MKRSYMRYSPPAKGSRRDLKKTLDDLTRRVVLKNETVCFTCGQPGRPGDPLQNSHLFTRTWEPTRFDVHPEGNNHAQHATENNRHEDAPDAYNNEYVRRFGQDAFDDLERRAHSHTKFGHGELLDMIREREEVLNESRCDELPALT